MRVWAWNAVTDCIEADGSPMFSPCRVINPAWMERDDKAELIQYALDALNEKEQRENESCACRDRRNGDRTHTIVMCWPNKKPVGL